jgi:uncharacterized paraquat-inducible protein A
MRTQIMCSECHQIIDLKGNGVIKELRCPGCGPELYIPPEPDISPYWRHRLTGMIVLEVYDQEPQFGSYTDPEIW